MPRAFIIHGYQGYPEEAWQPWLKAELEKKGFEVSLPAMPNSDSPAVAEWIEFITRLVGEPDAGTVLIGHSLGVFAVLRYLETLGNRGKAVGRTIAIAGGFPAGLSAAEADAKTGGDAVLRSWLTLKVDPLPVRKAAGQCTVILSDNDPFIPVDEARASYRGKLDAKIIVEHGKGHFNEDDHLIELPSALAAAIA